MERGARGRKNRNLRNLLQFIAQDLSNLDSDPAIWAVVTRFSDALSPQLPGQETDLKGWCPNETGMEFEFKKQVRKGVKY